MSFASRLSGIFSIAPSQTNSEAAKEQTNNTKDENGLANGNNDVANGAVDDTKGTNNTANASDPLLSKEPLSGVKRKKINDTKQQTMQSQRMDGKEYEDELKTIFVAKDAGALGLILEEDMNGNSAIVRGLCTPIGYSIEAGDVLASLNGESTHNMPHKRVISLCLASGPLFLTFISQDAYKYALAKGISPIKMDLAAMLKQITDMSSTAASSSEGRNDVNNNLSGNALIRPMSMRESPLNRFRSLEAIKGDAACMKGDWNSAIHHYTNALGSHPDDHLLLSNRSAAYMKIGDFAKSLLDAEKCIQLQPEWPMGYKREGDAHQGARRPLDSAASFVSGLCWNPTNSVLLSGLQSLLALRTLKCMVLDGSRYVSRASSALELCGVQHGVDRLVIFAEGETPLSIGVGLSPIETLNDGEQTIGYGVCISSIPSANVTGGLFKLRIGDRIRTVAGEPIDDSTSLFNEMMEKIHPASESERRRRKGPLVIGLIAEDRSLNLADASMLEDENPVNFFSLLSPTSVPLETPMEKGKTPQQTQIIEKTNISSIPAELKYSESSVYSCVVENCKYPEANGEYIPQEEHNGAWVFENEYGYLLSREVTLNSDESTGTAVWMIGRPPDIVLYVFEPNNDDISSPPKGLGWTLLESFGVDIRAAKQQDKNKPLTIKTKQQRIPLLDDLMNDHSIPISPFSLLAIKGYGSRFLSQQDFAQAMKCFELVITRAISLSKRDPESELKVQASKIVIKSRLGRAEAACALNNYAVCKNDSLVVLREIPDHDRAFTLYKISQAPPKDTGAPHHVESTPVKPGNNQTKLNEVSPTTASANASSAIANVPRSETRENKSDSNIRMPVSMIPELQDHEEEKEDMPPKAQYRLLENGTRVIKHSRSGQPSYRTFKLNGDKSLLLWESRKIAREKQNIFTSCSSPMIKDVEYYDSLSRNDISEIREGSNRRVSPAENDRSLTITAKSSKRGPRSIVIECSDKSQRDTLLKELKIWKG